MAANHGVDLRTAALQFSASPDLAAALVVGASSEQQILADYTSMQTKIPSDFWADLKAQNLMSKTPQLQFKEPRANMRTTVAKLPAEWPIRLNV